MNSQHEEDLETPSFIFPYTYVPVNKFWQICGEKGIVHCLWYAIWQSY